jgi:adenylate kinase
MAVFNIFMTPQTFIFIGRSGCGKGTQARLIQDYLKKYDPNRDVLYIQTGAEFREFIKGPSITQKLSNVIMQEGAFQPEFLAIHMWTSVLVNKYTGNEHLVLDGMPRKYHEAGVLDSVWSFYKMQQPHVVFLDLPKEEAKKRLMARKRFDDKEEEIEERLSWFESEVIPTLDFFKNNPDYHYVVIDATKPAEEVHKEILEKTKLG